MTPEIYIGTALIYFVILSVLHRAIKSHYHNSAEDAKLRRLLARFALMAPIWPIAIVVCVAIVIRDLAKDSRES